jgi:hypothetical protein
MAHPRETTAMVARSFREALVALGWFDRIRGGASAEVKELLDRPPLPIGWISSQLMDAFFDAMGAALTRQEIRKLGYQSVKGGIGPVLQPILRGIASMSGSTPAAIFSHMDRITKVVVKGTEFKWASQSPTSGLLQLVSVEGLPAPSYPAFEGTFQFAFDVCRTTGEVGVFTVSEDRKTGEVAISWKA